VTALASAEYAPACFVAPVQGRGPGWYLIGANNLVEAGPFPTQVAAERFADWLDDEGLGVNPAPWIADYSPKGLLIGTRRRPPRPKRRRTV
jgi:hypothetical protein